MDGVTIAYPLGSTLFLWQNGLKNTLLNMKQFFNVDIVMKPFIVFKSTDYLENLCNYFNTCHGNMSLSFKKEKRSNFLHRVISWKNVSFVTTNQGKPTFAGVYTFFKSLLPSPHKLPWKKIAQSNGFPTLFIDKVCKKFLDRLYITKPALATVEKSLYTQCYLIWGVFFTTQNQNKKCYKRHFKLL